MRVLEVFDPDNSRILLDGGEAGLVATAVGSDSGRPGRSGLSDSRLQSGHWNVDACREISLVRRQSPRGLPDDCRYSHVATRLRN